jgi:uncharacterized membrane protein HdeD (DUF308 family)
MLIILIGAGAAILPLIEWVTGSFLIGSLLVAGGLIEMFAGALRRPVQVMAMSAGGVTVLAGLLFLLDPVVHFTPVIYIIIAWLVVRSIILLLASRWAATSPVRFWTIVSAATDFVLALLLLAGLSIATIVVLFFGPTPEFIASFAWVLALSFLGTGLMLINVANCERRLNAE